jgi:hypothetical protein
MHMRILSSFCLLIAVAVPAAAQEHLITAAKRVPAAALDSTLPAVPFERWLASVRPTATIEWEVNDCGEGGDGRDAPTCVEAILHLKGDTTAHASLIVAGLDGKESEPAVWDLSIGVCYSFTGFKTLSDWAAFIRGQRR